MRVVSHLFTYMMAILFAIPPTAARGNHYYDEDERTFRGGLAGGLNFSQVDGDRYFGYHKPGLHVGGFVQMRLNERMRLQMELLYTQKGSHGNAVAETPIAGTQVSLCHIGLSYAEVPVVVQYKYGRMMAEAGAAWAYLLRTNEWILEPQALYIDAVGNRFNNTDINCVLGVGRAFDKHWQVNVRFQYSAMAIRPPERVPTGYGYGTQGQYNNVMTVRVLYTL
jgi:hypothetical protein